MQRLEAVTLYGPAGSGATRPNKLRAEDAQGVGYDLFVKYRGPQLSVEGLVREAMAAQIAAHIGLPVPPFFLVELSQAFVAAAGSPDLSQALALKCPVAFGSTVVPNGVVVAQGQVLPQALHPLAAEVLAFDLCIRNVDRRANNPNMFVVGTSFAIFDHEKALMPPLSPLLEKALWEPGGASNEVAAHALYPTLRSTAPNFTRFMMEWASLTDDVLADMVAGLPPEWAPGLPAASDAVLVVQGARGHLAACITEIQRALA